MGQVDIRKRLTALLLVSILTRTQDGNSTLTIGLVYRSPNIKVSKGECIIMGYFTHEHIRWKYLESTWGEEKQFCF